MSEHDWSWGLPLVFSVRLPPSQLRRIDPRQYPRQTLDWRVVARPRLRSGWQHDHPGEGGYGNAGPVTNSILSCWLLSIKDRCKKVRFQQKHNQGLRQLLLTMSWPRVAQLTVSLYLCSSGSNTRGKSRALEGRRVSSKIPSMVWDVDEGVARRNYRK